MRTAIGPTGWEAIRRGLRLRQNALLEFQKVHQAYGDLVYMPFPNKSLLVFHPADIKHILSANSKNYHKSRNYEEVRPILGQGLVTSEGELWKQQRRTIGREFHHSTIKGFVPAMVKHTQVLQERWQQKLSLAPQDSSMDIAQEMNALTLDIACETLFGINLSSETRVISQALGIASQVAIDRIYSLVKIPRSIPLPAAIRGDRSIRSLDKIVYRLIKQYAGNGAGIDAAKGTQQNILAKLANQGLQDKKAWKQLRDEVMTLLLAGHETTANALTWTLFLLSSHPEVEEKMREEISRVCGEKPPSYDDLVNLKYVGMVFQESMRLYPPVPVLSRKTLAPDILGGVEIRGGQDVTLVPFVTHRDPRFWTAPEAFIPERFTASEVEGRHSHSYFPFAHGPRKCIGEEFAWVEARLVLSMILQKFQLKLVPDFRPIPWATITLRSLNGMMMSCHMISHITRE